MEEQPRIWVDTRAEGTAIAQRLRALGFEVREFVPDEWPALDDWRREMRDDFKKWQEDQSTI